MKKKFIKKVQSGLLAAVMMAGLLQSGVQPVTVHAADTVKTMNLDVSYLAPSDDTWDATNDHKVYFGQYSNTPTAFRVLKSDNDTIMLDCDTILLTKAFDADISANTDQSGSNPNGWKNSDLESWLNGTDYYNNTSVFTTAEKSAIASTHLSASESDYSAGYGTYKDYEAIDYVYLLSANEANTLYADNAARVKTGGYADCWLRSAHAHDIYIAGFVDFDGDINYFYVDDDLIGVSPAFNINLSSVLFTSANGVSKSSDTLNAVADGSGTKEWKLTLLDSAKTVKVTSGSYVTKSGDTITVPYTYTGSDVSQISVMITSGAYDVAGTEILYYGKLNTTLVASGTGTFTLPSSLPDGYKMYIMAEDVNEAKYTDYASAPVEIAVAQTVATPTADLSETTYTENKSVTLSSDTEGATIYYTMTTDGTEPTDPTASDTEYTEAISLTGTEGSDVTYKIKAIAVKSGMVDSEVASFAYTISIPETTYVVTVNKGTGDGSYTAGTTVTITADTAESGKQFKEWTGVDGLNFVDGTDKTSATAKFTMPANAVTVIATYEDIPVVDTSVAPSITTQPQNASVQEGDTATFSIVATGTAPLSYQWMINRNDGNGWVNIDSATTETYTTSATDMDCNGFQYKCVVTNAKGSVDSSVVTLTVTKASEENTEYHITEGANQSIAENYDGTITIKADGELSKFVSVSMDGNIVDAANYTVKSGSTIVTFTKAYLDTLSVGNHTIRFTYTDGYVETALTVTKATAQPEDNDTDDTTEDATEGTTTNPDTNKDEKDEVPKTGDDTPVIWLFVLMLGSGMALYFTSKKKAVKE